MPNPNRRFRRIQPPTLSSVRRVFRQDLTQGTEAASVAAASNSRKYDPTNPPTRAAVTLSGCLSTINAKSRILEVERLRFPSSFPNNTPAITAAPEDPNPRPKGISLFTAIFSWTFAWYRRKRRRRKKKWRVTSWGTFGYRDTVRRTMRLEWSGSCKDPKGLRRTLHPCAPISAGSRGVHRSERK
jgi:hypothetical protein